MGQAGVPKSKNNLASLIRPGICVLVPLVLLYLPGEVFGIPGLTVVEHRVIALFVLAALCWILEPIPIYATSVLVIMLELLMISDKGLLWLRSGYDAQALGQLIPYGDIMATFASPIILLFLGGFFLAMAATKYRLDINLARVLLKPFGASPKRVLLGLMMITAVFSMFMSNTATTAMMLSILAPVMTVFEPEDRGRIAFALSIPLAANIGGIGTPIGTPPNAIAIRALSEDSPISFGAWMSFGVPIVLAMLLIAWALLNYWFPCKQDRIALTIKGKFLKTPKAMLVYATFSITILLWLFGSAIGLNSYVVAMIPVTVFSVTGIINKEDLKGISWDVLWLVAGGIALGMALEKSGLAANAVAVIPFETLSAAAVIGAFALLALVMANFMSNTATANLLLPIVVALGVSMEGLEAVGGMQALVIGVALAASMGMALPISTPPNALAHATGYVNTSQMARMGIIMGLVGLGLVFLTITVLHQIGFFVTG